MTTQAAPGGTRTSAGRALSGFFLSGFLFALPGALLPAWGYYLDPPHFITIGNYFLCIASGVIAAHRLAPVLLARQGVALVLVFSSVLACVSLLYLALATPPAAAGWRMAGLAIMGVSAGLLHTGLFHAITGCYQANPAGTVARGGTLFGLGCLAATLLAAGTFYAYTVASMVVMMSLVPAAFASLYANREIAPAATGNQPGLRQAFRDFRSPGAVLFALLLFFQFGNEWAIASWLPLFLVRRLGISPTAGLMLLALYWSALLVGRAVAIYAVGRVGSGKLLSGSVLAAIFGMVLLLLAANTFGAATAVVVTGGGFASIYPLVAEKIGRRFPYFHPGLFNGIFSLAVTGGLLAPATLGYFAEVAGLGSIIGLPLLGTCMVFILLLLIRLEARVSHGE